LGELGSDAAITVPLLLYLNGNPALWVTGKPKTGKYHEDLLPTIAKIAPKDKRFATAVLGAIMLPNPRGDRALRERRVAALAQLNVIAATTGEKVEALVAALEDDQAAVEVIQALQGYGKDAAPALPALKKLKQSPIDAVRNAAITAIAKIEL
jgi:hypothetical protein